MLDEERRSIRVEPRRRRQLPSNEALVGSCPLAGDRSRQVGAACPERGHLRLDVVGGEGQRGEPAASLKRSKRRRAEPGVARERRIEDPDHLEIRVAEPDEPVERAERVVAAAAAGRQAEPMLQLGGGRVRIRDRDDEVVDAEEHRQSVRIAGASRRGASRR